MTATPGSRKQFPLFGGAIRRKRIDRPGTISGKGIYGRGFFPATHGAPPHDWLQLSGGAIGLGIPLAVGAAVACPDRKVIALQADGSGMYTVQGLWTQAREKLNVLTLIWSNHSYAILRNELAGVGAQNPGPKDSMSDAR